jgi:hypothetical protein
MPLQESVDLLSGVFSNIVESRELSLVLPDLTEQNRTLKIVIGQCPYNSHVPASNQTIYVTSDFDK